MNFRGISKCIALRCFVYNLVYCLAQYRQKLSHFKKMTLDTQKNSSIQVLFALHFFKYSLYINIFNIPLTGLRYTF